MLARNIGHKHTTHFIVTVSKMCIMYLLVLFCFVFCFVFLFCFVGGFCGFRLLLLFFVGVLWGFVCVCVCVVGWISFCC